MISSSDTRIKDLIGHSVYNIQLRDTPNVFGWLWNG